MVETTEYPTMWADSVSAALAFALKNIAVFAPKALLLVAIVSIPEVFTDISAFLGTHVVAGIGGALGSAARIHYLQLPWKNWPKEALFSAMIAAIFGQIQLPIIGEYLKTLSPEMYPLANGNAIGMLSSIGVGGLLDFFKDYAERKGGKK